ncbi:hypothetical protein M422DRAFT_223555 [Sphaerobolus stellatus SS14]|nr:hypothetical protein M422DRAFT_223555 [Sphaerobolus stellatus SS14]
MLRPQPQSPPYVPGYVAFQEQATFAIFTKEEERARKEKERQAELEAQRKREEELRAKAAKEAIDAEWQKQEEQRRARLQQIKEAELRNELEWLRLGGRISNDTDAELRKQFDEEANLTEEERALLRAWEQYERSWEKLMKAVRPTTTFTFIKLSFSFQEIPWPVLHKAHPSKPKETIPLELKDFTPIAIAHFLLHPLRDPAKSRRDKLRDAIRHYHPDKFARFLHRIVEEDRTLVQEGVIIVTKSLNELMASES